MNYMWYVFEFYVTCTSLNLPRQLTYVNVLIGIMHMIHRVMLDRTTFDTLSEKY